MDGELGSTSPENAYLGLRHFYPEAVRNIRFLFDLGESAAKIKRIYKGKNAHVVRDAVDYMAEHPETGRVVWNNNGSYNWKELEGSHV